MTFGENEVTSYANDLLIGTNRYLQTNPLTGKGTRHTRVVYCRR
jgi:hypothetical protein